ncbi:M23 family metallopeptidase [Nocardia sp. NPDC127526]|uniref:M23 family metallopeptidase n=1 Tax=Nocardia sp. NPDC127526 TaxID=3345393 RepID=UPI0036284B32
MHTPMSRMLTWLAPALLGSLLVATPLGAAPLGAAPVGAAPVGAAPLGAAPLGAAPVGAAAGQFGWPLRPRPTVVRAFDEPERNWLPGHRGVDLAGSTGQQVLAAGDGIIVFAGAVADKPVVSIDHPGGLRTTYEPVTASIPVGRRISRGTAIGILAAGHAGCPVDACLHWGARRDRDYLDPLGLIRQAPIRLKPLSPS